MATIAVGDIHRNLTALLDVLEQLRRDAGRQDTVVFRTGTIQIARYEILNPQVVIDGDMALLTYNLMNDLTNPNGGESIGSRWNSPAVYQRRGDEWKAIHSHWSFTRHPALQDLTPQSQEGLTA
jgi:hypothetical protein